MEHVCQKEDDSVATEFKSVALSFRSTKYIKTCSQPQILMILSRLTKLQCNQLLALVSISYLILSMMYDSQNYKLYLGVCCPSIIHVSRGGKLSQICF